MTRLFNAFERMKRRRRCSKIMLEWFHPTKKIKSKLRRERRFKNRNRKARTDWSDKPWAKMLRTDEVKDPTTREGKYFRRRFRLPFPIFEKLIDLVRDLKWYPENNKTAPLELKILSVLRVLGRGGCFDDCWDGSGMHEETVRAFFHDFCEKFAQAFYDIFIKPPRSDEEIKKVERIYRILGFPGAIGSIDCVHIRWDKCPFHLRSSCKGKEGYPTLAYECCVDHTKRILSCTTSHYGARNDKTIVRYDGHVMNIKDDGLYSNKEFQLYNEDGSLTTHRGYYLICDGGYHKWRCLQCPLKHTSCEKTASWSCNLESVRKDVEDVFGILKKRFRLLCNAIELHSKDQIDNVFFTSCILHNILLSYDGYDKRWEEAYDWNESNPDDEYDDLYDGTQRRVMETRAMNRARNGNTPVAEGTMLRPFIADHIEEEVQTTHYELCRDLIVHHSVARRKRELIWL